MIKFYYKELAKKFHPDNKTTGQAAIFKTIKNVYNQKDEYLLKNLYYRLLVLE